MAAVGLAIGRVLIRPGRREPPPSPHRIILIKGGALGDVIMTTPLVRAIRRAWPRADITYLVGRWSAPVLANNPHLDHVVVVDDEVFFRRRWPDVWRLAQQVRRERFDLGFILDRHYTAGLFGWLAAVTYRVGFNRASEGFAHHRAVDVSATRYDGEYYLDLLRSLGQPAELGQLELFPDLTDEAVASQRWSRQGLDQSPVIGLVAAGGQNPGHTGTFKRWPADHYRQLLELLHARFHQARLALFGGPEDVDFNEDLIRASSEPIVNLAGSTVLQSAAMMRRCRLFITHDSGPMHMAAAVGLPVIAIFGPTDPQRLAPPGPRHTVLFRPHEVGALSYSLKGVIPPDLPQSLPCLTAIQPADVIDVIQRRYLDRLR